jgi:hypothetical protein
MSESLAYRDGLRLAGPRALRASDSDGVRVAGGLRTLRLAAAAAGQAPAAQAEAQARIATVPSHSEPSPAEPVRLARASGWPGPRHGAGGARDSKSCQCHGPWR